MRVKEIKDGTLINCKTREEAEMLVKLTGTLKPMIHAWNEHKKDTVYSIAGGKIESYASKQYIAYHCKNEKIYDFSDFILPDEPELTLIEILNICHQICKESACCNNCPMNKGSCFKTPKQNYEKVEEICKKWKAEHEKKEPEFEWVDMLRVINSKTGVCVFEEATVKVPIKELNEKGEEFLKKYMAAHDGEYFLVVDYVCRVKEV